MAVTLPGFACAVPFVLVWVGQATHNRDTFTNTPCVRAFAASWHLPLVEATKAHAHHTGLRSVPWLCGAHWYDATQAAAPPTMRAAVHARTS